MSGIEHQPPAPGTGGDAPGGAAPSSGGDAVPADALRLAEAAERRLREALAVAVTAHRGTVEEARRLQIRATRPGGDPSLTALAAERAVEAVRLDGELTRLRAELLDRQRELEALRVAAGPVGR